MVSSCNHSINEDSLCYCYCIWYILKGHVNTTTLHLPCAILIVLHIIMKWNRCKGQIDEMTCSLNGINFPFLKGLPNQVLVICELKKEVIATVFATKHFSQQNQFLLLRDSLPSNHTPDTKLWSRGVSFMTSQPTTNYINNTWHQTIIISTKTSWDSSQMHRLYRILSANPTKTMQTNIIRSICRPEINSDNYATKAICLDCDLDHGSCKINKIQPKKQ